ncbi:MAG TPA: chromosomal replication initiator protein DnaA [Candidatus Hypogeohydataceae bacterium YC38]
MTESCRDIWAGALKEIERQVSPPTYNLWFRYTRLLHLEENRCTIGVPNTYTAIRLQRNFFDLIRQALFTSSGREVEIGFSVCQEDASSLRENILPENPEVPIAKKDTSHLVTERVLRLEDFVVGPSNQLAYSVAIEILKSQKPPFNPLFIYGSVGLGKTHILQGIWNYIKRENSSSGVIYMPAEHWTNEFISALQKGRVDGFRNRYRKVDVLLIDDVHFLSNKQGIQEEFLHTFNALYHSSKRIVLASDAHPKSIKRIKESLTSRMVSGMVAEIHPPDFTTALAILKTKCKQLGKDFPEETLQYMADRLKGKSVRELESAITAVAAYTHTYNRKISVELAKEALSGVLTERQRQIALADIEAAVSSHFQLSSEQLRASKKTRSTVLPRHLCCYLARTLTNFSYEQIGGYFGKRRHTSCLSAMNKMKRQLEKDEEFRRLVERLIASINNKAA